MEKLEKDIATLTTTGLLQKFEVQLNKAHVNPTIWAGLNIDAKRGVAHTLARYCGVKDSSEWVEIYDYYTGKKLAKYSGWGFKTY